MVALSAHLASYPLRAVVQTSIESACPVFFPVAGGGLVSSGIAFFLVLLVVVCVTLLLLILERRKRHRLAQPLPEAPPDLSLRDEIIARLLRAVPDAEIGGKEPAAFQLTCAGTGDEPMVVAITRLQQALLAQPEQGEEIKAHFVQNLVHTLAMAETASFAWKDAARLIVPQLVCANEEDTLVRFPLGHGLEIGLVLTLPSRFLPVDKRSLERWKIEGEDALACALANLDLRSGPEVVQRMRHESGQPVFVCEKGDCLDASRLLLTDLWREAAAEASTENFFIAVPGRDFLIAFPGDDQALVDQLRERVIEDWQEDPHPLTWKFFKVVDGVVVPHEVLFH